MENNFHSSSNKKAPLIPQLTTNFVKGILLMVAGSMILPLMDSSAKHLKETISPSIVVFCRFFFQLIFLLPFCWKEFYFPKGIELKHHLYRAVGVTFATFCFFTAIQVMPLADSIAIFFCMPLLVTLLATKFLNEPIEGKRVLAIIIGLAGSLQIIQPSFQSFGFRSLLPMGTALGFSFYLIYTRKLLNTSKHLSPIMLQVHSGIFCAIITVILGFILHVIPNPIFEISIPEMWQIPNLVLVGFFAVIGHLILTSAFKYANASLLAPFQYSELISAVLLGWFVFDEIPTSNSIIGGSIIVGAGLYIFRQEYLKNKSQQI